MQRYRPPGRLSIFFRRNSGGTDSAQTTPSAPPGTAQIRVARARPRPELIAGRGSAGARQAHPERYKATGRLTVDGDPCGGRKGRRTCSRPLAPWRVKGTIDGSAGAPEPPPACRGASPSQHHPGRTSIALAPLTHADKPLVSTAHTIVSAISVSVAPAVRAPLMCTDARAL